MAAVQASQHNCEQPKNAGYLARHVCPGCGRPQPLHSSETFFSALGVAERFAQDGPELQKRFYEVSRALHPDRFTTSDAASRQLSLERMSFLNEAYRTLRDPASLREYILRLHGKGSTDGARGQIPMELAESWFELQDAVGENPEGAREKLAGFRHELENFQMNREAAIKQVERALDSLDPLAPEYDSQLERLSRLFQEITYLKSLFRDVERLESRCA